MVIRVDEPRNGATENEEFVAGDNLQESHKKKRRSRKSKQAESAGDVLADVNSVSSNPIFMQIRQYSHCESEELIYSSCLLPEPDASEQLAGPRTVRQLADIHDRKRTFFPSHLSGDAVSNGLKKGQVLKALFCVNAYNNLEAYCRIDGLQTDILISGLVSQNRAVEGDIVAVIIDKPSLWPRMKGSHGPSSSPVSNSNYLVHSEGCCSSKSKQDNGVQHSFSSEDDPYTADIDNGVHEDDGHVQGLSRSGHVDVEDLAVSLEKLCALTGSHPSKRPTGSVVAIIEKSHRRERIVGFLCIKQFLYRQQRKRISQKNKLRFDKSSGHVLLAPTDPKFTKMMVPLESLPEELMRRLQDGDLAIESDLVAAKIVNWSEESHIPDAHPVAVFGRGSDVDAQVAAILFENGINTSEFSPQVLSSVPGIPWKVPQVVSSSRMDFRKVCVFTIDPATATDLDDALSVEELSNGQFRVAVHIADVSYFVPPDTDFDADARNRATTVYLLQRKLPMLPPMLSDNLASLSPGEDRLTFSMIWKLSAGCEILDQWLGFTVIRSCCKLSYEHVQEIIDDTFTVDDSAVTVKDRPTLFGNFEWSDVTRSVKRLYEISKILRNNRFRNGAVSIENPKPAFLFDDQGVPYDVVFPCQMDSHFLVEEFMLLANKTAAELIYRVYPSSALLRRHPEPSPRKLQEFESICNKHGLKLDFSSASHFHKSLEMLRMELKEDSVLPNILISYAAKPMRLAEYVCSGDYQDSSSGDLSHYALAVPLYTHFTSPLRRYADIIVHRTLKAVLEVERLCSLARRTSGTTDIEEKRCLTGLHCDMDEMKSAEPQDILVDAANMFGVGDSKFISDVAAHCNGMKLAARHVKDATDKLCIWALVRRKGVLYSEATVLGLGPRFMSVYIHKLAIERRIYYDEFEGLTVAWLESTATLVLSMSLRKHRIMNGKKLRPLDDAVMLVSPTDSGETNIQPGFFPITVRLQSTFPVALHAVGGDDGPIDVVASLYCCSYFCANS